MAAKLYHKSKPSGQSQFRMECEECSVTSAWTTSREHAQNQVDAHNRRLNVHRTAAPVRPTEGIPEIQYVVVTMANNGVVHVWGPYNSRLEANNAKARLKNRIKKEWPIEYYPEYHEPGAIKYSVCQINDGSKR